MEISPRLACDVRRWKLNRFTWLSVLSVTGHPDYGLRRILCVREQRRAEDLLWLSLPPRCASATYHSSRNRTELAQSSYCLCQLKACARPILMTVSELSPVADEARLNPYTLDPTAAAPTAAPRADAPSRGQSTARPQDRGLQIVVNLCHQQCGSVEPVRSLHSLL